MKNKTFTIIAVCLTCIFAGAFIGGITNMVNGAVSPLYFKNIMRWHDINNIWRASVAQGILEGIIYGIIFASIFTTVFGVITKGNCPLCYVVRFIVFIVISVFCCWLLGGIIAIFLSVLSPEFYRQQFRGVPEEFIPMIKYAWVGGSIWGAMFGGLLSAIVGSVIFHIKWKKYGCELT